MRLRAIAGFVLTVVAAFHLPAQVEPSVRSSQQEPQLLERSGVAVWAKGYRGLFIAGLDGALYDAYPPATIQRVQKELKERGLYGGPITGILDWPTMKAIYAFQEVSNLQRCGVPTPHTRQMLEQGSHTDLSFRSKARRERTASYLAVRSRNVSG